MNIDELNQYISRQYEDEHLEFKEAKNQFDARKLMQYCVGLANEGGGLLFLGISNTPPRQVVGTKAFQNPAKIQKAIFSRLRFRVDVDEVYHPDGRVVVLIFRPDPQAVYTVLKAHI